jgi:hypothetical protein
VIGVGPKLCAGPRCAGCDDEGSYSLYGGGLDNPFKGALILAMGLSSDMSKDDVVEQGLVNPRGCCLASFQHPRDTPGHAFLNQ